MDFEKVLKIIINEFEKEGVRCALMGGFGMGVLGIVRTTMDMDFLVDLDSISAVEKIMKKLDYKCVYKTENVSQFVSDLKIFGEIDFIHAFRKYSCAMLSRAKEVLVFNNQFKIKVLIPEDIIGLKLQAGVNDKSRLNRERADIESIMEKNGCTLDWSLIEEYFLLFAKEKEFRNLREKYGKVE